MFETADLIRYSVLGLVITLQDSKAYVSRQPVKTKNQTIPKGKRVVIKDAYKRLSPTQYRFS